MAGDDFGGFERFLRVGEGRRLKRLRSQAEYIGTLEPELEGLSDEALKGKTAEFRQRVANGEALEDILFEAFATVREAFKRAMGVRLFDVQMMGGIVLHEGDIAEMKTGEGKTFVATMPLYLNSLTGQNVHLVTVNDYLAKRDPEWVKPAYDVLGIRAGFIQNMMPFAERTDAYSADVTYGTNAEFGFDYLRDNMAVTLEGTVQRGHTFAIVDEVDSILIDEARTPLIISGEPETAAQVYYDFARVVKGMTGERSKQKSDGKGIDETERSGADYLYDEKFKTVSPAQSAIDTIERALGIENLYDARNMQFVNHLNQALKAQSLFQRDVDYVVQDGEVKIVDEFTGRIMEGRRWSEGLHQAVEAKEGVPIQEENVTLATITLQNYFRLYEKLAGMTGTAKTEEKEFVEIYNLHVVEIPTNVEVARADQNDFIFKTKEAKYDAVLADIKERHEIGQPVLVGTISVEVSEHLSQLLQRVGIPHNVLNAKAHEREAEIIKDAGQPGAVTIATNMAGRGVDIKLAEGMTELGGLYVLGTERHEARRIDNQLRGRSGPSGRPGRVALLPLGQRRPGAAVRRRQDPLDHGALQGAGRPADGVGPALEADRERAEEGRGAELRRAQERPQVRRRHEHAARGDLRPAAPGARGRGPVRRDHELDRRPGRAARRAAHRGRVLRGVGPGRARAGVQHAHGRGRHRRRAPGGSGGDEPRGARPGLPRGGARAVRGEGGDLGRARLRGRSSATSCSRSSTPGGASTSRTWTTSARASTCGRSRRRTRSSSTAPKGTRCSRSSAC